MDLPLITFIDHQDIVRYFSHGKERIFPRTKAVIGRTVQNCHPPKSAHIVEAILYDFKSGKKDQPAYLTLFVLLRYPTRERYWMGARVGYLSGNEKM